MAGEGARMSKKEAAPIPRRYIQPIMSIGKVGNLGEIEIRIGRGRMGKNSRKGGGATLPPSHATANVARKYWEAWWGFK